MMRACRVENRETLTMIMATWKKLILAAVFAPLSSAAMAQPQCDQRNNVLGHLAERYKEAPVAFGVTSQGRLIEVLSTIGGDTWTIIVSTPDGTTCLIAAGEAWRTRPNADAALEPTA